MLPFHFFMETTANYRVAARILQRPSHEQVVLDVSEFDERTNAPLEKDTHEKGNCSVDYDIFPSEIWQSNWRVFFVYIYTSI